MAAEWGGHGVRVNAIAPGFILTDLTCGDAAGTSVNLDTRTASIAELHRGDAITCTFTNSGVGTTRTQGFWQTHWSLLQAVWNDSGSTVGGIDYHGMSGRRNIGTCTGQLSVAQAAGGFWASIPWTTERKNRGPISKAKMTLLQQLLAAMLNRAYFGASPAISASIDSAKSALCGSSQGAISSAASARPIPRPAFRSATSLSDSVLIARVSIPA